MPYPNFPTNIAEPCRYFSVSPFRSCQVLRNLSSKDYDYLLILDRILKEMSMCIYKYVYAVAIIF